MFKKTVLFFLLLIGAGSLFAEMPWNNPGAVKAPGLKHESFVSASMGQEIGYLVGLPDRYDSDKQYPVIYMLHGAGKKTNENSMQWDAQLLFKLMRSGDIPAAILVLVNGKSNSAYIDHPKTGILAETVLVNELVPHIDKTYSTLAAPRGRAFFGFSMGGYGGVYHVVQHPEVFGMAVAYAPAFSWAVGKGYENAIPLVKKALPALKLNGNVLVMYQGMADPVAKGSDRVHRMLTDAGIPHHYVELAGVGHKWGVFTQKRGAEGARLIGDFFNGKQIENHVELAQ